ncbi:unnamed protein product [Phytophthora fragariaefolia]|uniref:Unnamed protein product n=1 Tax=Phytophthora fragariaefolia TaxID=1490495 RepID=A0A9W6XN43_9STRA|nr:unnamed protein product [Phytophthora fragariaefolia]
MPLSFVIQAPLWLCHKLLCNSPSGLLGSARKLALESMAPTSKSAVTADKKKSKKSSRSGADATSRGKDKDRRSKEKDRKSSFKKKEKIAEPAAIAAPTPATALPPAHDPDAIQLFRRYDCNRSGVLTRLDFLQLLRDYANPVSSGWGASLSRPPLSLTDSSGIPLGYQRADRNSEFEAGQLFERYDKDRTGALTLDAFHVFFADFKPQLRAFVEETSYRALAPAPVAVAPVPLNPVQEEEPVAPPAEVRDAAAGSDLPLPSPDEIRARYRAALWKLRRICKDELVDQRERIVRQMAVIRDEIAGRQRDSSKGYANSQWKDLKRVKRRQRSPFPGFDDDDSHSNWQDGTAENDATKLYEAMEDDLDRLEEIIRHVRRYLNKGKLICMAEIGKADEIEEEAQCLAMKNYGDAEQHAKFKKEKENEPPLASDPVQSPSVPPPQYQKQKDQESLLRVKDQMIYQLLQERAAMRKERAAVEASLKKLSEVSTREMKKWARLTDDMQTEIEQLRSQLRSRSQQRNAMP